MATGAFSPTRIKNAFRGIAVAIASLILLAGCSSDHISFLDPQGPVAAAQKTHLLWVVGITMIVVLPVLLLVPLIAWRYRRGRGRSKYTPDWEFSLPLEIAMWGIPSIIVVFLGVNLWSDTSALDPYKPLAIDKPPIPVQVVGLDWKWLFIYPDQGIATMGELAFPQDHQLALTLTSDTVMQSFMIAALGGQIYTMPGMTTELHLAADRAGRFEGENTQFNGFGFQHQKFDAVAMTPEKFASWVAKVKAEGIVLDRSTYAILGERSTPQAAHTALGTGKMPPEVLYFNAVPVELFKKIISRYHSGKPVPAEAQPGAKYYKPENLEKLNLPTSSSNQP